MWSSSYVSRTNARKRPPRSATCSSCRRGRQNITASLSGKWTSTRSRAQTHVALWMNSHIPTRQEAETGNATRHSRLLDAGINVISTSTFSRSRNALQYCRAEAEVRVKERVPDEVVAQADQIVTVDLRRGSRLGPAGNSARFICLNGQSSDGESSKRTTLAPDYAERVVPLDRRQQRDTATNGTGAPAPSASGTVVSAVVVPNPRKPSPKRAVRRAARRIVLVDVRTREESAVKIRRRSAPCDRHSAKQRKRWAVWSFC